MYGIAFCFCFCIVVVWSAVHLPARGHFSSFVHQEDKIPPPPLLTLATLTYSNHIHFTHTNIHASHAHIT